MQPTGRFGLTGWQKTILWIAFLLCIWRFLQVPRVFDAILKFYAAGEVPGTDIVLSPDAALWFVFITSSLGAVILFAKLFIFRAKPQAAYSLRHVHTPPQQVVSLRPLPEPKAAKPLRKRRALTTPSPVAVALVRLRTRVATAVAGIVSAIAAVSRRSWSVLRPLIAAGVALLGRGLRAASRMCAKYAVRLAAFIALILVTIWDWAKPHVRSFDTWLEVRLNQNEITSTIIDIVRRVTSTASSLWKKAAERTDNRLHSK